MLKLVGVKKLLCKLGRHQFTNWILKPEDPYKAWNQVEKACQLIYGFVQMGTKINRIKTDMEKRGEVSAFITEQLIILTNKKFRKCNRCGKIEWKYPEIR